MSGIAITEGMMYAIMRTLKYAWLALLLLPVKLHADWVCPGSENPTSSFVCKESDFILFTTINGKITLSPNGPNLPPCKHGYLVVYVVNLFDQPIKFDGLFGDAVVRGGVGGTAVS